MGARTLCLLVAVALAMTTLCVGAPSDRQNRKLGQTPYRISGDVNARSGEEADPGFGQDRPGQGPYRATGDVNARSGEEADPGFGQDRPGQGPYRATGDVNARSGEEADPGFGQDRPGQGPYRATGDVNARSGEEADPGFGQDRPGQGPYRASGDVNARSGEEADPGFGQDRPGQGPYRASGDVNARSGEEADPDFGVPMPAQHHNNHGNDHDMHDYQHHNLHHKSADDAKFIYASCALTKDIWGAGLKRSVRGNIDMRQMHHGGDLEVNFDISGLETDEQVSVSIHSYGVHGSCLSIGDTFSPSHGLDFAVSSPISSEGDLGQVNGDDYGTVRSMKTFSHGSLSGTHSILGRAVAVRKGTDTLACCTLGHNNGARWASLNAGANTGPVIEPEPMDGQDGDDEMLPAQPEPEVEDDTLYEHSDEVEEEDENSEEIEEEDSEEADDDEEDEDGQSWFFWS